MLCFTANKEDLRQAKEYSLADKETHENRRDIVIHLMSHEIIATIIALSSRGRPYPCESTIFCYCLVVNPLARPA